MFEEEEEEDDDDHDELSNESYNATTTRHSITAKLARFLL